MSSSQKRPGSYRVGYGKPPPEHRFKKGQSGNPAGRPRKTKSIDQLLTEVLQQKVPIVDQGEQRIVTLAHALVMKLVSGAINGTTRDRIQVLQLLNQNIEDGSKADGSAHRIAVEFRNRLMNGATTDWRSKP